jgi:hypothetical protein
MLPQANRASTWANVQFVEPPRKSCKIKKKHHATAGEAGVHKRLLRHEDELFQVVLVAELSANNNQAERSIRPLVVIRKISGAAGVQPVARPAWRRQACLRCGRHAA